MPRLTPIDPIAFILKQSFASRTLERGLAYARFGRVRLTRSDSFPVTATVQGSGPTPYAVRVAQDKAEGIFTSYCTCPVEFNCKHGAATILLALDRMFVDFSDDDDSAQQRGIEEHAAKWLSRVGDTSAKEKRATSNRCVAYVLRLVGSRVVLHLLETRRLKRGGFGKPKSLPSGTMNQGWAEWIELEDRRLLALVSAESECLGYDNEYNTETLSASLLDSIAETGHLFWEAVSAPLSIGEPLKQTLRWKEEDQDHAVLGVDDDIRIIPADVPHYVHIIRGTIGRLDLGDSKPVLSYLIEPPLVPKSMIPTVERSLAKFNLHLETSTKKQAKTLEMVSHVNFEFMPYERYRRLIQAECVAAYGKHKFAMGQWEHSSQKKKVVRDLVLESQRLKQLNRMLRVNIPFDGRPGTPLEHEKMGFALADEVIPKLRSKGWVVEIDEKSLPTKIPDTPSEWVEEWSQAEDGDSWFCELGVLLGGKKVSLLPILLQALRSGAISIESLNDPEREIAPLTVTLSENEKIVVPGERLRIWLAPLIELFLRGLNAEQEFEMPSMTAAYVSDSTVNLDHKALSQLRTKVLNLVDMLPERECRTFKGTLRDYQREGLAWLSAVKSLGLGGLLCDDMGLGKTVQVLALLEKMRAKKELVNKSPVLILAPRSVVGNWKREAEKFAPKITTKLHLGSDRASSLDALLTSHVIITSYQTMLRDKKLFGKVDWQAAFFDEAQAIKNSKTKLRRAVADLK